AYDYHTQAEQQNSDLDGFTETPTWSVPPLWLLVCAPLPLFLGFALIRNIRSMGSVSVVANISICAGVVAVLAVMLHQFSVSDTVQQATGATLPVIPIESSMEDNRHNFRSFLRGSLVVVTAILGGVGTIGYLRYGQDTRQIVVQNLPTQSLFVVILDATLILGVIFTFPLQIYPVIQMTEKLFLARYRTSASVNGSSVNYDEPVFCS
uniref:Aa_trans domain-containing protein n=1 Tax=Macrostomum lignano TaxID=282301 RepID=A0A1I8JA08_9PLAT